MHEIAADHGARLADRDVRIRQVGDEQLVVFLDARAEDERTLAVDAEREAREIPRALVIQPLLACAERADVARVVEQRERVVVFENRRPLGGSRRRRENVELIADLDDVAASFGRDIRHLRFLGRCKGLGGPVHDTLVDGDVFLGHSRH